jgi:prepilin-type N-terminal cleavage/methylation domain-containing protein
MCKVMKKNGLTLIEVLAAIIVIGIAIASLIAANSSFTKANNFGLDLSTAEFLTEQIRELTTLLPVTDPQTKTDVFGPEAAETLATYDDLDDFDGAVFCPPIGSNRSTLNNFTAFKQEITVENVSNTNFEIVVADHSSHFVRMTVRILLNNNEINSASWIRANN